jgi:hypothetical protein
MPAMARAIALLVSSSRMAETLRIALVTVCAAALIFAGEALPF